MLWGNNLDIYNFLYIVNLLEYSISDFTSKHENKNKISILDTTCWTLASAGHKSITPVTGMTIYIKVFLDKNIFTKKILRECESD